MHIVLGEIVGLFYTFIGLFCNLTINLYTYFLCAHPTFILLTYLFIYTQLIWYVSELTHILQTTDAGRNRPRHNATRKRQGKRKRHKVHPWFKRAYNRRHKHRLKSNQHKHIQKKGWLSEHDWYPLLEPDHSTIFDQSCNRYPHYLDAAMGHLDGDTKRIQQHPAHCYTSIDSEIFAPRG